MHAKSLIVAVLVMLTSVPTVAATVSYDPDPKNGGIAIVGEIVPGDYDKLITEMKTHPEEFFRWRHIKLDSLGGNVAEAMKIASLFESMGETVFVLKGKVCASACALIFLTAPSRYSFGVVALHRPYFRPSVTNDMSGAAAMRAQQALIKATRAFLVDHSVPERFIEALISTSSAHAYVLTRQDLNSIGSTSPEMQEMIIAKCSSTSGSEKANLECAQNVHVDFLIDFFTNLIGKAKTIAVIRNVVANDGELTTNADGSWTVRGQPAPTSQHYSPSLDHIRISPKEQAESDRLFSSFASRAKALGIPVKDPRNPAKRIQYTINVLLPRLAERGDASAWTSLGLWAEKMSNPQAAIEDYTQAAEYGDQPARLALSLMYSQGKGIPVDRIRALAWAILAQSNDDVVKDVVARLRGSMTSSEVAEATALAQRLATKVPTVKKILRP